MSSAIVEPTCCGNNGFPLSKAPSHLQFHSAVSDHADGSTAVGRAVAETLAALGGRVDLAFLFFTADHRDDAERIVERVWLELDPQAVVGCCGEGVIGGDAELERKPGLALLAASLPGVG